MEWFVALTVVLVGGVLSGLVGFGFALLAVPPLLIVFDPPTVVTISVVLSIVTGGVILLDTTHEVKRGTVAGLLPPAIAGVLVGVAVLKRVEADAIRLLASAIVIGFTALMITGWRPRQVDSPFATVLAGATSGAMNATTGIAGPPVALLFSARSYGIDPFRASISAYFVLVDLAALAVLLQQGIVGWDELGVAALLVPPAVAGTAIGRRLVRRVSLALFRRLTLALLIATGLVGIVNALL